MTLVLHFPSNEIMKEHLSKNESLNFSFYKDGITEAIIDLAVAKLAGSKILNHSIKPLSAQMIAELRCGKDSFTGEDLPNLGKLGLPDMIWGAIALTVEKALLDCGKAS